MEKPKAKPFCSRCTGGQRCCIVCWTIVLVILGALIAAAFIALYIYTPKLFEMGHDKMMSEVDKKLGGKDIKDVIADINKATDKLNQFLPKFASEVDSKMRNLKKHAYIRYIEGSTSLPSDTGITPAPASN